MYSCKEPQNYVKLDLKKNNKLQRKCKQIKMMQLSNDYPKL